MLKSTVVGAPACIQIACGPLGTGHVLYGLRADGTVWALHFTNAEREPDGPGSHPKPPK